MEKNMTGLYAGRVNNDKRRLETPVFCSCCGKTFEIKNNTLMYKHNKDGMLDMICPACNDAHNKSWELKSITDVIADNSRMTGVVKCIMSDGRKMDYAYGWGHPLDADIPPHFSEKLGELKTQWYKAKNDILIQSLEIEDSWDKSCIKVVQNNGAETVLQYRATAGSGIILNKSEVAKVDAALMALIVENLKSQLIFIKETK